MRQVVQRRKRRAVGQSRRGLDDAGLAVRASVGDLEDAAGLAAELPRDGVEIRPAQPPGAGRAAARQAAAARVGAGASGTSADVVRRHRRWCATATVYHGSPVRAALACCARLGGHDRARRQLHLVGDVAGHDEAEPLAGLRRDVNRVGQLDLLLLEVGDLRRATRPRSRPAASSRCAGRSTCAPDRRSSASARTPPRRGWPPAARSNPAAVRTAVRRLRRSTA